MSKTEIMQETEPMEVDSDDIEDLSPLLESIHLFSTASSQLQDKSDLQDLARLSLSQLKKMISSVEFASWSDDVILDFFNTLSEIESLPNTHWALLIYAIFYKKIAALDSSAPRLLMNSIVLLAKKEGKANMDGLLIPLLFQSKLAKPQNEVIVKIVSESLNASQRYSFLQVILFDGEAYFTDNQDILPSTVQKYLRPWNDSIFQIIHAILSTQPLITFTKTPLHHLVESIQALVRSNPKDKGSMQILLLLTSKYSQSIIEFELISLVEDICQMSTMFLKRAVLGQIASIKKNMKNMQDG
ncbi:uncharacterized protein B0P05DRAFT_549075 [Gilbertella persicaria]|nr:uncharacterized protein B0P05DRAFT_549075 [Gilbertella persicaria]KAI8072147.1 hypothetical protein B0P05DRAFT_549075 [Gilbertella persicaria]